MLQVSTMKMCILYNTILFIPIGKENGGNDPIAKKNVVMAYYSTS